MTLIGVWLQGQGACQITFGAECGASSPTSIFQEMAD